jgi:PHD/YefM family antitoxin component YafN of YafNO toxin-antitoxin module
MKTVTSAEIQKNFGAYRKAALQEPLAVQHYGKARVVLLSMKEYMRLKDLDRQVVSFAALSDAELAAIAGGEIPEGYRYLSEQIKLD